MTRIVCIVPRLGAGIGGGKLNAVFRRMSTLVERERTEVVLLDLDHGVNQRIAFARLQQDDVIDRRVRLASLYEICATAPAHSPPSDELLVPDHDRVKVNSGRKAKTSYFRGKTLVMRDVSEETAAGTLTIRQILTEPDTDIRIKHLDGQPCESLRRKADGTVFRKYYAAGRIVAATCHRTGAFAYGLSYLTRRRYDNEQRFQKDLVERHFPEDCIVFIDGITTAYLSRHMAARKILFLHADHRAPQGHVVPRSKYLIDHFEGDAIVTATHVHRKRLQEDTAHKTPIRVIPHYIRQPAYPDGPRQHICTVSRLDLKGKPVHQCIEAFIRIMHRIPDTNYLIYGSGLGAARLEQLIEHHGCQDRVFLMGQTSNPTGVFAASLMSLAPTMTEGFGLSLLESLALGCPVISYDVDYGPRELIRPGANGVLVPPGDIDAMAHAILTVFRDQPRLSAQAYQSVARYSFEAYRDNYNALIDDLVGREWFFDIAAPDLKVELEAALPHADLSRRARILDLYIRVCEQRDDLEGTYHGFRQRLALTPDQERPLVRCIWLSRRLGRGEDCRAHLEFFRRRFPAKYADFIRKHPVFWHYSATV